MNAEQELFRTYCEWRRLVQAETKAIQTRNWNLLSDCHVAIRDFQSVVGGLTSEARAEWLHSGCNVAAKEQNLRVIVADLIDLTRQNQNLLQAAMARTRIQIDQLGEAGKNLKRIRSVYGNIPSRTRTA